MADNGRKTSRVSHSSLERTACDECRRRKLRCVRDIPANNNSLSECTRCVNAGVVCVTSPAKPLGRHSIRQTRIASDIPLETSPKDKSGTDAHRKGSENIKLPYDKPLGLGPPGPENSSRLSPPLPIDKHQGKTLSESGGAGTINSNIRHQAEGANYTVKSDIGTIETQCCRLNLRLSQLVMALGTGTGSDRDLRAGTLDTNSALLGSYENSQTVQSPIKLVLDITSAFLSILQQCRQELLNHGSPNTEPGNGLHQSSQEKTEAYGPSKHAEVWIFHAFMQPISQVALESTATSVFNKRQIAQPLSTSMILNLTSCYLHFITIYDILLQPIHLAMHETSPPSLKNVVPIGGLNLAGSWVQDSGLQVKMLIQVMEHQLELIERDLGLSDRYRVCSRSSKHPGQADGQDSLELEGIFDRREAKVFLEFMMRLNGQAGTRGILSLQQKLRKVSELTRKL